MKRILLVLLFTGTATMAMPTPVSELPTSCTYAGAACGAKTYDVTSGVCRTIRFDTSAGQIQVQVCDKVDRYELYRQNAPSGGTFKVCVGGGAVDQLSGFSSFTSTTLGTGCGGGGTQALPLVDPNSTGFAGQTRAANHKTLLDAWRNETRAVQEFDCGTNKKCAWVPWYTSSTDCTPGFLKLLSECGGSGAPNEENSCMVTDELSQVFLAYAQGPAEYEPRLQAFLNTFDLITSGPASYRSLLAWRARRNGSTVTVHAANRDTASDADARVILGLYIAAASQHFSESARDTFRARANTMAADFLLYDFKQDCKPGRNGVQICKWLATGGNAAAGAFTSNNFSFAGYHGDAVIALLAAHRATGNAAYLDAARVTVNAYLLAANFNNSTFSVPPKAFRWDLNFSPRKAVCTDTCSPGEWDADDAPRAVSICKAQYYASLLGVTLPADLDTYCTVWMNSGGVTSTEYAIQYTFGGTPVGGSDPLRDGPHENGLGLALNFHYNKPDLVTRLDQVGPKWQTSVSKWEGQNCHGVYRNAFFTTNLGSAIGRDMAAFTGSGGSQPPQGGVGGLNVVCNAYVGGPACTKNSDTISGSCRTLVYTNPGTSSQILICPKNGGYEMYLQTPSTNGQTTTCVDTHCVGPLTGFAAW